MASPGRFLSEGGSALQGSRHPTVTGCTGQRKEDTQFSSFIRSLDKLSSSVALVLEELWRMQ